MTKRPFKVFITRQIPESGLEILKGKCELEIYRGAPQIAREELLKKVEKIDGLLCLLSDKIDKELIDRAVKLKVVSFKELASVIVDLDFYVCSSRSFDVGIFAGFCLSLVQKSLFDIVQMCQHCPGGGLGVPVFKSRDNGLMVYCRLLAYAWDGHGSFAAGQADAAQAGQKPFEKGISCRVCDDVMQFQVDG